MVNDNYELDKAAHDAEYEKIERQMFENTSLVEHPHAVLVGGQTGAGKSSLNSNVKEVFPDGNYVSVSTDELRDFHPQIDEINKLDDKLYAELTREDAAAWQQTLFDRSIETDRNIRYEGTLQNTQGILDRLQDLKDNGYQVTIQVIATHERDSTLGIYERYERGIVKDGHGRYVPQEFHDRSYSALPDTVREIEEQQLADRIQIFDRSGKCIHDNQLEHDKWSKPGSADALEKGREQELTPEQIKEYSREWQEKVFQPMEDRDAPQNEIEQVREIADRCLRELEKEPHRDHGPDYAEPEIDAKEPMQPTDQRLHQIDLNVIDQDLKRDLDHELNSLQELSSVRDLPSEVRDYLKSLTEPDRFDILAEPLPENTSDIDRALIWNEAVSPGALDRISQYLYDNAQQEQQPSPELEPAQSLDKGDQDLAAELYNAQDRPQEQGIDLESQQALEILTQLQEPPQIDRSVEVDRGTTDSGTRSAGMEHAAIEHTGLEQTPGIQHTGMEYGYGFDTTDSFDRGGDGDADRGDGDIDRGSER